jgi:hypothetical protein
MFHRSLSQKEIIQFYDAVAKSEAFCLDGVGDLTHRWKREDV